MNQVSISEMTNGVSAQGANEYLRGINMVAIGKAIEVLQDTSGVKASLESGWQGAAEQAFEKKIDGAVNIVVDTLDQIKANIESLVTELVEEMANQDQHILDDLEDFGVGSGSSSSRQPFTGGNGGR